MSRGSPLVAVLLVASACRQPNPDWDGPDDAGGTASATEGPASTTTATTAEEGSTTSAQGTSSDSGVETEGKDCNNDNMCPGGLVCGPDGTCQLGDEGDPCGRDSDCQAPTDLCGPNETCQAGNAGDPCADDGDCGMDLTCMMEVCG